MYIFEFILLVFLVSCKVSAGQQVTGAAKKLAGHNGTAQDLPKEQINRSMVHEDSAKYIWPGPSVQCLEASVCELTRSSIFKEVNVSNEENIKSANFYASDYLRSQSVREVEIDLKCAEYRDECWKLAQFEASRYLKLPLKLARKCNGEVLPNMLLLCDPGSNGLDDWPENIKYLLGNNTLDYKPCGASCQYPEYKQFHEENGKKYPEDFPKSWDYFLKSSEEHPEERSRQIKEVDVIHTEFQTGSVNRADTIRLQCSKSKWLVGLSWKRPYRFQFECASFRHTNREDLSTHEIYDNNVSPGSVTDDDSANCNSGIEIPSGSYIIGLRLRMIDLVYEKYYTVAGVKCSGEQFGNFYDKFEKEILCPFRSAVCSLGFSDFSGGKYVDMTSVGCCAMPIEMYYSGVHTTPYEPVIIESNRLEGATVGETFNDYTDQVKDRRTDKGLPALKKTFFCQPGQFIVSLEQYIRLFEIEAIYGGVYAGPVPFLETKYYCGNGKGGPQTLLVNGGLYDYKPYVYIKKVRYNLLAHDKYHPYSIKVGRRIECQSGFVNQYQISRYISTRRFCSTCSYLEYLENSQKNKFDSVRWEERVWCTGDGYNDSGYKEWYHNNWTDTSMGICGENDDESPNCAFQKPYTFDSEVKCKQDEAICGMEFKINDHNPDFSFVTMKLYKIRVICCPIPPIIVENVCPQGVGTCESL